MDLGESAVGIFAATTHVGARFLCYFHSLTYKTKFAIHNVKNKVSFYLCKYQLDTNRNFERCLSIRCLAPQHIFQFFAF